MTLARFRLKGENNGGRIYKLGAFSINMKFVFLFFSSFLAALCLSQPLSKRHKTHEKHMQYDGGKDEDWVAIFFLSSLKNAAALGVPEKDVRKGDETRDFWQRILSIKSTWAAHVKHFYPVTGIGKAESLAFQKCENRTEHFNQLLGHGKMREVYNCQGINVLHSLKHSGDGNYAQSGCGRAEEAMLFYLDMRERLGSINFPSWFIFTDDDYYARLSKLRGLVTHPQIPPGKPYAISDTNFVRMTAGKDVVGHNRTVDRLFYGFNSDNCTVPCVHRSVWQGFAMMNSAALLVFESALRSNFLTKLCRDWNRCYHDVGIGIMTWMYSIPYIPACCGCWPINEEQLDESFIMHKAGQQMKDKEGKTMYQVCFVFSFPVSFHII